MNRIMINYNHILDKEKDTITLYRHRCLRIECEFRCIIKDLKNLEDTFDFGNLDENDELFSLKNKKVFCKFKIETPKNIWTDEFVYLRSKMYAFKCGKDSKNTLKSIFKSQSKHIKFDIKTLK